MGHVAPDSAEDNPGDDANADADDEIPVTGEAEDAGEEAPPHGFDRWRRESALGNVGTGVARGLQAVFAPPADEPVIVASVPGDPPDPERLQVILDPDDPSKSVVIVPRPHDDVDPPAG
jgi:hypothetical protein